MSLKHYREEITVFFWKRIPSKSQADLSLIKLSLSVSTFYSEDELSLLYGWDLIAKSSWVFFEYQLFLLWDFNFSSPTRGSYDEVESAEIVQQCWAAHIATLLYDSPSPQREKLFKTHHVFSSPTRREMYFLFSKRKAKKKLFLLRCVFGSICRVRCSSSSSSRASSFKQSRGQSKRVGLSWRRKLLGMSNKLGDGGVRSEKIKFSFLFLLFACFSYSLFSFLRLSSIFSLCFSCWFRVVVVLSFWHVVVVARRWLFAVCVWHRTLLSFCTHSKCPDNFVTQWETSAF